MINIEPENFQELAGLTAYYDERNNYQLVITQDEQQGKVLKIIKTDSGKYDELNESKVPLPENRTIYLRAAIDSTELQFFYSLDETSWIYIGEKLDATILSDEYDGLNFTGAFVGIAVFDYRNMSKKAQFDYFEYLELK